MTCSMRGLFSRTRRSVQSQHSQTSDEHAIRQGHAKDTWVSAAEMLNLPVFKFNSEPFRQGSYIRLIKIRPDSLDDCLSLEVDTYDLDEAPTFNALSYAWGDSTKTHRARVSVDGAEEGSLLITTNLDAAIRGTQSVCQDHWLWADAICVNQEDIPERNHQIQLMARIYGTAKNVLIWLGDDPDSLGDVAFDLVNRIRGDRTYARAMVRNLQNGTGTDRSSIDALQALLDRPWFLRTWTMQEVGLSSYAIIVCGERSLPWIELYDAYAYFFRKLSQNTLDALGFDPERIVFLQQWATARDQPFLKCLITTQWKYSTDPRDKVFALLSHASAKLPGSEQLIVQPDYGADLTDIYIATCDGVIQRTNSLDILRHAQPRDLKWENLSHASYAPQWHRPQTLRLLPNLPATVTASTIQSQPVATLVPIPNHRYPSLKTLGTSMGTVSFISEPLTKTTIHLPWRNKSLLNLLTAVLSSVKIPFPPTTRHPIDTFFRVLCGGETHPFVDHLRKLCSKEKKFWFGYHQANERVMGLFGEEDVDGSSNLISVAGEVCEGRRVFLTDRGYMGIAAEGVKVGDGVWALGEQRERWLVLKWFVLRKKEEISIDGRARELWELKGECYVEKFMDGKVPEEEGVEWRDVYLV